MNSESCPIDDSSQLHISGCSTDTLDITHSFMQACQIGLVAGELCHIPCFNLVHSMSAIEVMHPKMDIRVQGARRVISTTEALSTGVLPLEPFQNRSELIGVMDELLAATTNWLTGDSLAQTVFTCMYMHCTQLIQDPHLRTFCELLRRVIYQLRHIILLAGVFDEEDFYPSTHGMPLHGPSATFDRFLDTDSNRIVLDFFNQSNVSLLEHSQTLVDKLRIQSHYEVPTVDPLTIRLEFLMKLLQFTDCFFARMNIAEPDLNSLDMLPFELSLEKCTKGGSANEQTTEKDMQFTGDFWSSLSSICCSTLPVLTELNRLAGLLMDTVNVGTSAGRGRLSPKDYSYGLPGFEPFLNQTYLPSYIPRFVVIHDRPQAFRYLCGLTENLLKMTETRSLVTRWDAFDERNLALHLLWSIIRHDGQQSHGHVVRLLNKQSNSSLDPTEFHSNLPSCLLSRALCWLLYCIPMRYLRTVNAPLHISSSSQVELTIQCWLNLEPKVYHNPLRTIISELVGFREFLDVVAHYLIQIPRIYCLNRSRQRSTLGQWLQDFPELLNKCQHLKWIVGVELAKKLGLGNDSTSNDNKCNSAKLTPESEHPPYSVPLRLSSYMFYYYYQLAWDYIVTGFQLELYTAHEWAFIYTFMMDLSLNISLLFELFGDNNTDGKQTQSDSHKPPAHRSKASNKKKSKRKKVASMEKGNKSEAIIDEKSSTFSVLVCGPGSDLEYLVFTCHRSLATGTTYALRALQMDSGGDSVLDGNSGESNTAEKLERFSDPEKIYARRLGLFFFPPGSPLDNACGCSEFHEAKRYLTSGMFSIARSNRPLDENSVDTTALYNLAMLSFEEAQHRIQFAQVTKEPMLFTINQITKVNLTDDLCSQLFGTPDKLADLEKLAAHNVIACRVLMNCPERRPTFFKSDGWLQFQTGNGLASHSSPVQLDFSFLPSRAYPLIRLVSTKH